MGGVENSLPRAELTYMLVRYVDLTTTPTSLTGWVLIPEQRLFQKYFFEGMSHQNGTKDSTELMDSTRASSADEPGWSAVGI